MHPQELWTKNQLIHFSYIWTKIINAVQKLNLDKNSAILDIGCHEGMFDKTLHYLGFRNVYAFDISKDAIQKAQLVFPEIKDSFFIHDAYNPNLPSSIPNKFDLIISTEVIEHLVSPKTFIKNIRHWLKDDGYLIITTPYHGYLKNLVIALFNKFDSHFEFKNEDGHIRFFSKKSLKKFLKENGLTTLAFRGCGRFPYFWRSMLMVTKKNPK